MRGGFGDREPGWINEISEAESGLIVQARSIEGGVHVGGRPTPPVPAQLPSPGLFTNRREEMDRLGRLTGADPDEPPALAVITGAGGVGKTTLALQWLHRIRDEYDAGQLFVDLRGFSAEGPMHVSEPLERFLRALGVPPESIPVAADEQSALFRSLTTGRRLIVMLDNAASAAQVRPLLPGPGPALVVVTTRRRLPALARQGARFVEVEPLNEPDAVELLDRMVGSGRVQAERDHAVALVRLCGRLPLAVCTTGARLAARRRRPIEDLVRELADESRRLSALSIEDEEDDVSLRVVFHASYQALPTEDARRLYRLLGLHPGAAFGVPAAAALAGTDTDQAARSLEHLVAANLLEEDEGERFRFHDLVRLHARDLLLTEPEAERNAAFARLANWLLDTVVAADLAVRPGRWRLAPHYENPPPAFTDRREALAWLELELPNVIAFLKAARDRGLDEIVWQVCEGLWGLLQPRKHYGLWIESYHIGLASARACGDVRAQARMLEGLALAHLNLMDFPAATRYSARALVLERRAGGSSVGEASALECLGTAALATGHPGRALDHYIQALAIHRRLGRPRGIALMTRHIGEARAAAGRYEDALDDFASALRYFEESGDLYHQSRALIGLGRILLVIGRLDEAGEILDRSLATARDAGTRHQEAMVHLALADLAARREDRSAVREHLRRALDIFTALGTPQADEVRRRLAESEGGPPP